MSIEQDEFRFLSSQASELGIVGAVPEVLRESVDAPGGEVSVLVWGSEAAVTLLHGGGLNAHTWDETILVLDRPALAVDLPGHGESAWRADFDYSAETNAVAVATVIDTLAGGRAQVVVGQSLGGLTAIALAGARPDVVRALVIVDVSPGLRPGDADQVRDFLSGPQVFASRDEIVEKALAAGIGSSREALERGVEFNTRIRDDGTVIFKHHLANPPAGAAPFSTDFRALWPALEGAGIPVLLVYGSQGFLSDEVVDEFASRVPQAVLVRLRTGHNVQEQRPAELADAISAFLSTL